MNDFEKFIGKGDACVLKKRWLTIGILCLTAGAVCVFAGLSFFTSDRVIYIILEIIGAALILTGITPLVRVYNVDKRQENRTSGGRSGFIPPKGWILADIIGITRNLRGSSNDEVEYYVICQYYDGVTRTNQTFTSRPLKEYPGKEIIGKKVKVIFHSSDPEDYTVDLDSIQ
ncbi:MAG: hypothetical protein ACOYA9_01990 [Bilifractor sp.]|jgi:hypothetical protein